VPYTALTGWSFAAGALFSARYEQILYGTLLSVFNISCTNTEAVHYAVLFSLCTLLCLISIYSPQTLSVQIIFF
jgi:transposase